ncbi:hypothetical protein GGQ84_000881 [Desulfitispora alkaliphila]|uniref:hypothetical protein n=1 Tax=Desulfitispora alkaliphila TaxID=622674 RepID=UPI003D236272
MRAKTLIFVFLFLLFMAIPVTVIEANSNSGAKQDNLNILFLGVDQDQLEMISVYSVEQGGGYASRAYFFPVTSLAKTNRSLETFADVYASEGVESIVEILGHRLATDIDYHVVVDQQILSKVGSIIGPIVVNQEEIDIEELFSLSTPYDDQILGEMLSSFKSPQVFFVQLPELFVAFRDHISTDFAITPTNLYTHYQLTRRIDVSKLQKVVVRVIDFEYEERKLCVIPQEQWISIRKELLINK